jgi:hypothetical protein
VTVKFETLKAGDVLYDCHNELLGNTMCRGMSVWIIVVKSIDGNAAWVSWNGNPDRRESRHYFAQSRIRRAPPEWVNDGFGSRCHFCREKRDDGHRSDCQHPKAISRRKWVTSELEAKHV